jgi:hypothetical protein
MSLARSIACVILIVLLASCKNNPHTKSGPSLDSRFDRSTYLETVDSLISAKDIVRSEEAWVSNFMTINFERLDRSWTYSRIVDAAVERKTFIQTGLSGNIFFVNVSEQDDSLHLECSMTFTNNFVEKVEEFETKAIIFDASGDYIMRTPEIMHQESIDPGDVSAKIKWFISLPKSVDKRDTRTARLMAQNWGNPEALIKFELIGVLFANGHDLEDYVWNRNKPK